jgi:phytoene dehydrogenase-like protein
VPRTDCDAVIVGSGPNGLSAAISLAQQGLKVLVLEARDSIGGGVRSAELTLPGFIHDVCSAVHPLAVSSPFFRSLDLAKYGLNWCFPEVSLAHPLDHGRAVLVRPSLAETVRGLAEDGAAYTKSLGYLVRHWDLLVEDLLGTLRLPRRPFLFARFGLPALMSAAGYAKSHFRSEETRALFAGMSAHGMLPLESPATASFGLALALSAHAVGWPVAQGGSQRIVDAMAAHLIDLGGEIRTSTLVTDLAGLPSAHATLLDVSPKTLLAIAGDDLPGSYSSALSRYRYGPGVFKVDWALDAPIPWSNPEVSLSSTVHLGGTLEEIAASERAVARGEHPNKPYVLLVQSSLVDPARAPAGKHTAWAYCHVPNASTTDMRSAIESQIERFAPGFRERILAFHTRSAAEYEVYNPNYVGGDINSGSQDLAQFFTRPAIRWDSYALPLKGVYLCSSATPPGGGVHGMCGFHAARSALRREFNIKI